MAECLILAFQPNNTSNDTGWNLGDVITVAPDGQKWGAAEGLPKFWRIIVTGATVSDCWGYLDSIVDANGDVTKLRGKRLDYNSLSTPQKRALNDTGYLTVTKAQADAYIKSVS